MGEALARRLGLPFLDTDRLLAEREGSGRPAGELLAALGEPAFRDLEEAALGEALAAPAVVATGGGAVERAASRRRLSELALCVHLDADPAVLRRRLAADPTPRPALGGGDAAQELSAVARRRAPLYAEVALFAVATDRGEPEALARGIERELRARGHLG